MGAHTAGTLQEANRRAVRWKYSGAAGHTCGQRFPVGIPSQNVNSLPYNLLAVLLSIARWQLLPSNSTANGLRKPLRHRSKADTLWLQIKSANSFWMKSCEALPKNHNNQRQAQGASSWTLIFHDISTSTTSRDSTPSGTRMEHLLAMRKYEKLKSDALKENYTCMGTFKEIEMVVSKTATETRKAQKCCRRTLREWTSKYLESWWRVRLKASHADLPLRLRFVADYNTLKFKVYITFDHLSAPKAQTPLSVLVKSDLNEILSHNAGDMEVIYTVLYKEVSHLLFKRLCQADL